MLPLLWKGTGRKPIPREWRHVVARSSMVSGRNIEFDSEKVLVNLRRPGEGEQPFARFSRRAVTTSEIFPGLDYFVRYDEAPA